MNRRFQDKPLWQRVELALVWSVSLYACVIVWLWLIGKVWEIL